MKEKRRIISLIFICVLVVLMYAIGYTRGVSTQVEINKASAKEKLELDKATLEFLTNEYNSYLDTYNKYADFEDEESKIKAKHAAVMLSFTAEQYNLFTMSNIDKWPIDFKDSVPMKLECMDW